MPILSKNNFLLRLNDAERKQKMSTPKKEAKKATAQSKQKSSLPKSVTEEPRGPEEMHLGLIKHQPSVVKSYLEVSDDKGEVLMEKALEKAVFDHCAKYLPMKAKSLKEPEKLLAETQSLANVYMEQISFRENTIGGVICKYRIRQGLLFLVMKKAVKAAGKMGWEEWFTGNYSGSKLRSAQDSMKLAKAKNIIKYAFLGKFCLLQILRQIDNYQKMDDPIGGYLKDNGVDFKPEEETHFEEVKFKVAVAINFNKVKAAKLEGITKRKVEALVKNGLEIESKHLRDMELIKQAGGNVVAYFDKLIASDTDPIPVLDRERKVAIFKKTTDKFLTVLENAIADAEYRGGIEPEVFARLKQKVAELEPLVLPN
jgi:hypothetical protein